MLVPVFATQIISKFGDFDPESINAIATVAVTFASFLNLVFLCRPYSKWRISVVCISGALLALAIPLSIFLLSDMIHIVPAVNHPIVFTVVLSVSAVLAVMIHIGYKLLLDIYNNIKVSK